MLRSLLEYNKYCNDLYIHFFEEQQVKDDICHTLLCHIINAQLIWNARLKLSKAPVAVWQIHNTIQLKHLNTSAHQELISAMKKIPPMSIISYQNTQGEHFQNVANDIIYHLVNHATYHRGQIAAKLKEFGMQAPKSDYIFYKQGLL